MGFSNPYFQAKMEAQGWKPGDSWCAFFDKVVLHDANIPNTITGWSPSTYNRKDVIFTDGHLQQDWSESDVLIMSLGYQKYLNTRYKGIGHTGIIDRINDYSVDVIEGNTNEFGTRDSRLGDAVLLKVRPLTKYLHITRINKDKK